MKIFLHYLCCFLLFFTLPLFSEEDNRVFLILKNRDCAGMFSMFGDVLALIHSYENHIFQGIEVDFGNEGLYYDEDHGPNWWNYYCEPICYGEKKNILSSLYGHYPGMSPIFFYKDREEAYHLIQKYIRFRPHIQEKIQQFRQEHFQNQFVIGCHYRGTDAPHSSPSYEAYLKEIQNVIHSLGISDYKIFIATDEQPFIDFMSSIFPNRICYQQNALRSDKGGAPLHMNRSYSHYLQGEETIVDCVLLSSCSFLMLTYSNFSLWASLLNPYAPMIDVSRKLPIVR